MQTKDVKSNITNTNLIHKGSKC